MGGYSGCNINSKSSRDHGGSFLNDTNIEARQVVTGQSHFTVEDIEIFSIRDSMNPFAFVYLMSCVRI
jgi:hypothetical protein